MYLIGSSSSQLILSLGEPPFYPWIWLQTLTSIATLSFPWGWSDIKCASEFYRNVVPFYLFKSPSFLTISSSSPSNCFPESILVPYYLSSYLSSCDTNTICIRDHSTSFSSLQLTVALSLYAAASSKLSDNLSSFYHRHFPPCFPSRALTTHSWSA